MRDAFGREINYLRLSITDRCNLRCRYCMPKEGVPLVEHDALLRYEELLEVARAAVSCGIDRFKVTGGEPLLRRGCADFVRELKALPGVRQVTLTTNGLLLLSQLDALTAAGLNGVNISLDTLDDRQYADITRRNFQPSAVVSAIEQCAERLPTKVNAVLLPETADQLIPLARLAERLPVDVRFIEQMPVGQQKISPRMCDPLACLREVWPDLTAVEERRGNGPAHYYGSSALLGRIGFIEALHHVFCDECNRLRLTATGVLKPCLCYEAGISLRPVLRGNGDHTAALQRCFAEALARKPQAHCFGKNEESIERNTMNRIGG